MTDDAFDFDTPIPLPQEWAPLPEGPAYFEIQSAKKGRRTMGKLGEINVVDLVLLVTPLDGSPAQQIEESLKLHTKTAFLLYQFGAAIGVRQHGDSTPLSLPYGALSGMTGFCEIEHHTYTVKQGKNEGKERTAARVKSWLDAKGRSKAGDPERVMINPNDDVPF